MLHLTEIAQKQIAEILFMCLTGIHKHSLRIKTLYDTDECVGLNIIWSLVYRQDISGNLINDQNEI